MIGGPPLLQTYAVRRSALGATARVLTVQLLGGGADGGDADAETIPDAEVMQPLGLFARPALTDHTEALGVEVGDEVYVLHMLDKGGGGGSVAAFTGVAEGATWLYGAKEAGARLELSPDGDATLRCHTARSLTLVHPSGATITIGTSGQIDVTAAAGQDLRLNAGTKQVAREEDALNVGTLVATAGPYPVLFTYVPGTAGAAAPAPPGGVALAGVVLTGTGAPTVKA